MGDGELAELGRGRAEQSNRGRQRDREAEPALWAAATGPYLFGEFCAADAFYAPVATRFVTYGVELKGAAKDYQQRLLASPGVTAWSADGVKETEFVAMDEPYATAPS